MQPVSHVRTRAHDTCVRVCLFPTVLLSLRIAEADGRLRRHST